MTVAEAIVLDYGCQCGAGKTVLLTEAIREAMRASWRQARMAAARLCEGADPATTPRQLAAMLRDTTRAI